jgi:ubiquinone/menaquinone biosynthesis C-methylase UbiE
MSFDMSEWKLQDIDAEDKTAENYDLLYNRTYFAKKLYSDFAKEIKNITQSGKILELACGTGNLTSLLASQKNLERYCIDFSWNMLQIAKKRCSNCAQADLEFLPFKKEHFDLVYIHSALHHFLSLYKIVNEVKRILKPRGYLVIQEPNDHRIQKDLFLSGCLKLTNKVLKKYPDLSELEVEPSEHHGPINLEKIVTPLEELNFKIIKKKFNYYSSYLFSHLDNSLVHSISCLFDQHYVNKRNDGYLIEVIGRKQS